MNNDDLSYSLHLEALKGIFSNAKELRSKMTKAERILWDALRNNKLKGYKFRRQHPMSNYIADFYCHQAKLVIEVDGSIHHKPENKEYDEDRTNEIEKFGINVIRFTNDEIINYLDKVLLQIEHELEKSKNL